MYIIQNDYNFEIYIGYTNNLVSRLKKHNEGGNKSTAFRKGSWKYVYVEVFRSKADALERERKLKHHAKGKHELLKRIKNSLLKPKIGEGSAARSQE